MPKHFINSFLNPRRIPAGQAARYLGVSRSKFLQNVKTGVYPKPIRDGGNTLWDVRVLDNMVDAQSGLDVANELACLIHEAFGPGSDSLV